ncbi:MAG TPA: Uma2 family endonuclease [Bryobacteraceae bacterium]|nr:Uma2 family endonuclease [Bryobacteraceae bacterium]
MGQAGAPGDGRGSLAYNFTYDRRRVCGTEPLGDELVHEHTKANLIAILVVWLHESRDGQVFASSPFILDDYNCLAPDIGVLTGERLKRGIDNLFRGAPHLAVEVVSRETARRLRAKIGLYLKYGSKAVWVVYPDQRLIEVHWVSDQVTILGQDQILKGHDALPGFSTPVRKIFAGL